MIYADGTMCETLILAFAGTGVTSLLIMMAYGISANQLLSSDYITSEVMHSLTGSMAVILAVPITAAMAAVLLDRIQNQKEI